MFVSKRIASKKFYGCMSPPADEGVLWTTDFAAHFGSEVIVASVSSIPVAELRAWATRAKTRRGGLKNEMAEALISAFKSANEKKAVGDAKTAEDPPQSRRESQDSTTAHSTSSILTAERPSVLKRKLPRNTRHLLDGTRRRPQHASATIPEAKKVAEDASKAEEARKAWPCMC